ncbi:MAG: hypothetical protein A370_04801 [Clostridium sp. Maddingley MBC34-26]|nr:MAG: hypothetical protein A370_04801 [Clostridium sp. Maddingley MBC34-26]
MLYIYSISVRLSFLALILFLFRIFINKNNLNLIGNKEKWKQLLTLLIVCMIPVINIFFTVSSIYISILMKNKNFIKLINQ